MLGFYLVLIEDDAKKKIFEDLYNNNKRKMLYVAKSVLHDDFEAEDAVHDAFIGIARNIHVIENADSDTAVAYLACAVRHACYTIINKKKKLGTVSSELIDMYPEDRFMNLVNNIEKADMIENALKKIDFIYSDTIALYYGCDMTTETIAGILGCSEAAVRQRLSRGRKLLAEEIMKSNDMEE